jgi:hypothetical protein
MRTLDRHDGAEGGDEINSCRSCQLNQQEYMDVAVGVVSTVRTASLFSSLLLSL